jgi:hypothetical protein
MATRYFADWVLDPALHEVEYPLSLIDAAQSWLINDMRSITLWADLYVRVFAARPSDDMITIGESWLVGHGGNMNSWIDVWRLVRPHIDDGRACEIALGWLARSRWDLTSWPNVFNEVAGMKSARAFVPRIVMVGRNWQAYHSEYPYNAKKVRQSIDYLEAMSKTSSNAD